MVGASFLIFFQNHLTFFKFPRVISGKIIFSAKVPSKCPLKLAISEGIFHLCEKNLQKGVGKYRFSGFQGALIGCQGSAKEHSKTSSDY